MLQSFHHKFKFLNWQWHLENCQLELWYELEKIGKVKEVLSFPRFNQDLFNERYVTISKACDWVHWLCGVSYYKAGLAKRIEFQNNLPSIEFSKFLEKTWKHGLGELAYENKVNLEIQIPSDKSKKLEIKPTLLRERALLPFGGGKDSLLSYEQLEQKGIDFDLFMVGNAELIKNQARDLNKNLVQVTRKIDPKLIDYNNQGAFNGHVPITSINSVIAVLSAILLDYNAIIFSNERSADSPNVIMKNGLVVNHQYSKSYEFEKQFSDLISNRLLENLRYFSLQRPNSELSILQSFSKLTHHFKRFSSCNRNFHLSGSKNKNGLWCGDCPKCRFTFLGLAPFLSQKELIDIFGNNLLDDSIQVRGFEELLGLVGIKPFECVGETKECQLAMQLIAQSDEWKSSKLVKRLSKEIPKITTSDANEIFSSAQQHNIPTDYLR